MQEIDIEKLGEKIMEYRDGGSFISSFDSMTACREIAEKVNEIIRILNK